MTNPAKSAGPEHDGSYSLAKESKAGLSVAAVLFVVLQIIGQGLGSLDTSSWSGWWVPVVTTAISTVAGLITAYLKKNR